MVEAKCYNCGDVFEPEHSEDDICKVCYEHELAIDIESSASQELPDAYSECSDCGAEFYPTESEYEFTCSDCANNPYL